MYHDICQLAVNFLETLLTAFSLFSCSMASRDLVIGHRKLETKFFDSHVQHTTFHPDVSQEEPAVNVVKTWYRGRDLGRGISGTVFLEWSEIGESRVVKDIVKDKNSAIRIDYKRKFMAMATLAKVRGGT